MLKSNCKICGERINICRDTVVREGENLVHSRCVREKCMMHIIYCSNCDSGPVMLEELDDRERTRCQNCGVYMHDGYEE